MELLYKYLLRNNFMAVSNKYIADIMTIFKKIIWPVSLIIVSTSILKYPETVCQIKLYKDMRPHNMLCMKKTTYRAGQVKTFDRKCSLYLRQLRIMSTHLGGKYAHICCLPLMICVTPVPAIRKYLLILMASDCDL